MSFIYIQLLSGLLTSPADKSEGHRLRVWLLGREAAFTNRGVNEAKKTYKKRPTFSFCYSQGGTPGYGGAELLNLS